jgi:hypothetical protein
LREAAVALIGGVGHVDGIGRGPQERLEAALGGPALGQLIEALLGGDDLVARFLIGLGAAGAIGDVAAERDEFAPHRKVVDHLRIVARREGRDRRPGKAHEIGRPAQLAQPRIVLQEGLERHRRGESVLLDARDRDLVDAAVDGVEEMLGLHDRCDAVVDLVAGQDRAQKLLLGLDIMGQRLGGGFGVGRYGAQGGDVGHARVGPVGLERSLRD